MPNTLMPFGMTVIPGSNIGGTNVAVPTPASPKTPAIGGGTNPFLPTAPTGSALAPMSSSINLADIARLSGNWTSNPNNPFLSSTTGKGGGGMPLAARLAIAGPFGLLFGGGKTPNPGQVNEQGNWVPNQKDFIKAMKKAGYSAGVAGMLYNFIQSGAGFNPAVAEALIAAQQPGVEAGRNDILEQFGSRGLRGGSPAALGLSDYLAGVQLNQGQIWAGLYQQSVQNYMNVLMGGKGSHTSTFDQILKALNTSANLATSAAAMGG